MKNKTLLLFLLATIIVAPKSYAQLNSKGAFSFCNLKDTLNFDALQKCGQLISSQKSDSIVSFVMSVTAKGIVADNVETGNKIDKSTSDFIEKGLNTDPKKYMNYVRIAVMKIKTADAKRNEEIKDFKFTCYIASSLGIAAKADATKEANKNNLDDKKMTLEQIKKQFEKGKDYIPTANHWTFIYFSPDETVLKKFAEEINKKESKTNAVYFEKEHFDKYMFEIEDEKKYTPETLLTRLNELNEIARKYEVISFLRYSMKSE